MNLKEFYISILNSISKENKNKILLHGIDLDFEATPEYQVLGDCNWILSNFMWIYSKSNKTLIIFKIPIKDITGKYPSKDVLYASAIQDSVTIYHNANYNLTMKTLVKDINEILL